MKPQRREPWRKTLRRALRRPKGRRASHQLKNLRAHEERLKRDDDETE